MVTPVQSVVEPIAWAPAMRRLVERLELVIIRLNRLILCVGAADLKVLTVGSALSGKLKGHRLNKKKSKNMLEEKNKSLVYIGLVAIVIAGLMFVYLNDKIDKLGEMVAQPAGTPAAGEEIKKEVPGEEEEIPQTWKEITIFTGAESQKTDSFYIPTDEWKIIWTLKPETQKIGQFSLKIYRAEDNSLFSSVANRTINPTPTSYSESFFYYEGKENFYFDVVANDLESWKITVYSAEE